MYFKYHNPDIDDKKNLFHLKIFAVIADNVAVSDVFKEMRKTALDGRLVNNRENLTAVNADLPTLAGIQGGEPKAASDFTVYIQYPRIEGDSTFKKRAADLRVALLGFGFNVPEVDGVSNAPAKNEIRYYKPSQQALIGKSLVAASGKLLPGLVEKTLPNGSLPNDMFEIWIGKAP